MNIYWIEVLSENRAQAWCDQTNSEGVIEVSYRVGSPAPKHSVEQFVASCSKRQTP